MLKILVTMISNSTIKINQTSDGWLIKCGFAIKWQNSGHKKTGTNLGIRTKRDKTRIKAGGKEGKLTYVLK